MKAPLDRLRGTLVAGAVMGCCMTAAACSEPTTSGSTAGAGTAVLGTPPLQTTDGLSLPIEAYLETASDLGKVDAADDLLIERCMSGYGFSYTIPQASGRLLYDTDPANMSRRYGISDPALAARYGYNLPPDGITPAPSVDLVATLSDAEYEMLYGHTKASDSAVVTSEGTRAVPGGGCVGVAGRALLTAVGIGAQQPPQSLATRINDQSLSESQTDPQVIAVIGAWSRCMAASGYQVASPYDAGDGFADQEGSAPSTANIDEAVTDVRCKTSTKLVSIWVVVETRIQDRLIGQNQLALTELASTDKHMLDAAVTLIEQA